MKKLIKYTLVAIVFVVILVLVSMLIHIPPIAGIAEKVMDKLHAKHINIGLTHILISGMILLGVLSFIIYKFDYLYRLLQRFFFYLAQAIRGVRHDAKDKNLMAVLFIPFVFSIYCAFTVAVSIDEALTYISNINPWPIYRGLAYYPEPNNHVFYTLLAYIFHYLPVGSDLFKMRLIPILVSLITSLIAFSFMKKYYTAKVGLFVVGISSILFMSIYYSFLARGYAMIVLFFVICLYATLNIIKKGGKSKDWVFFTIGGILGMYTIPSFLYPFFTLNLLIFIFGFKYIKQQIIYNLLAGLCVLVLYSPIMLNEGIGALTNNPFVKPMDRYYIIQNLLPFFSHALEDISGINIVTALSILFIAFVMALRARDKFTLSLWAVFCITPFIILIAHSVIPFTRTFVYYGFILVFLIGVSCVFLIEKIPLKWLLASLITIQMMAITYFHLRIEEYESFNTYYDDVNKRFIKDDGKTFYMVTSLARIAHQYQFKIRGLDHSLNKYIEFKATSADTINNYDYVVIDVDMDSTKIKKPIYQNKWQRVYVNKTNK